MVSPGPLRASLKRETRAETPLALLVRPECRSDVAECVAIHIRIGKIKVRMVRGVQRFCAELELNRLRNGECSINRKIRLEEIWTSKVVSSRAPESCAIFNCPCTVCRA